MPRKLTPYFKLPYGWDLGESPGVTDPDSLRLILEKNIPKGFGVDIGASSGLTLVLQAGVVKDISGSWVVVTPAPITLAANTTSYIERDTYGTVSVSVAGWTVGGTKIPVAKAVTSSLLATPAQPTGTASAIGGTLPAGTTYARIVAVDAQGNLTNAGVESVAVTTTGATGSIAWSWAAVPNSTSYRIYAGTTPGGETSYFTSTATTFTQTVASGTAGTPPTVNATTAVTLVEDWRPAGGAGSSTSTGPGARRQVNITTALLASGANEVGMVTLNPSYAILRVATTFAARVRLYRTVTQRDADIARLATIDPVGNHGCLLEVLTVPGNLIIDMTPAAVGGGVSSVATAYYTITNTELTSQSIVATLDVLPLE